MPVTVAIVDDHNMLRAGLRTLLNAQPDLQVVGEAPDGDTALRLAETLKPDVMLVDISMPGPDGIEVTRLLRKRLPSTAVLILTMHEDHALVREALEAGARGYLPKRIAEAELVEAVRVVARGGTFVPPDCLPHDGGTRRREPTSATTDLTRNEIDLLRLVVHGQTNAQIVRELKLPPDAVADMRAHLADKLGLYSRAALVRFAQDHSLL